MKLRTQLILAFLLLSVLPLSAMTLYSYRSSQRAFRHAVELEAGDLASEMGQRMELVVAELDRRFERLDTLPYETLLSSNELHAQEDDREAGLFMSRLRFELGDVAPLIESLEYQALAPRPSAAPDPPAAPVVPMVIHISRALFAGNDDQVDIESTHVVRNGTELALFPGRVAGVDAEMMDVILSETLATVRILGGEELEITIEGIKAAVEQKAEALEGLSITDLLEDAALQIVTAAEERHSTYSARKTSRSREAAEVRTASDRFDLGREFKCDVQDGGETVGTVRAQINSEEVLRSVLSEARRDQGEIPFAVGSDGRIFTPDQDDRELLETELRGLIVHDGNPGGANRTDNWIVITRQGSPSDTIFGIARPVGESMNEIRLAAVHNMGFGLSMIAIAMLGIIPLSGRMTRDLSRLSAGATALSEGHLDTRVPVRSRDEIGNLARTFNHMGEALQENQRRLVQQERIRRELELCRRLQNEMLPPAASRLAFADVRAVSIPAREVGGDFFNYFTLPDGEIAVLVGDVSGKGVPAAMLMANLQATLRARLPVETDLATLATQLDADLESSTPAETYVTLFMGVLDSKRGVLRFVNAGHNPQYLARRDGASVERMRSTGRPLGLLSGGGYVEHETAIGAGDWLFLFTDGLTEMANPQGEEFGEQRLERAVLASRDGGPEDMLRTVEESIGQFRGDAELADDATMMVIRIEKPDATGQP